MALDPTMMPELPKPACTFADHSYPAFTAKQMRAYAEAAILSYLQHAGEGEPVAWAEGRSFRSFSARETNYQAVHLYKEDTALPAIEGRRVPLYAHPTLTTDTPVAGDGANYPVPDGWKPVPVEPTREMLAAGEEELEYVTSVMDFDHNRKVVRNVLREAIAAAPQKGGE